MVRDLHLSESLYRHLRAILERYWQGSWEEGEPILEPKMPIPLHAGDLGTDLVQISRLEFVGVDIEVLEKHSQVPD
jgi:hypothetical protein